MIQFDNHQTLLKQFVAEFAAAKLAPIAQTLDEEDRCPVELFKEMGNNGFLSVFVPEEYGGAGQGFVERAIILEEIAYCSAGFALFLMTHDLGVIAINDNASAEQKKKYLPDMAAGITISGLAATETSGGSDFMGQQTTAEFQDGQWSINGRKCFITNSHVTDVNVITANSGTDEKGRPSITAFILESALEGLAPGRKDKKIGLRGSIMGDLIMHNVKVGEDAVLGRVGGGTKVGLSVIGEGGRSGMAAISLGIIRACLDESVKFSQERIIYGKSLGKIGMIQEIIAENRLDYETSRLLTYQAVAMRDNGQPCTDYVAMAKLQATEAAVRCAKRTMDLMGGYGVIDDYPVGRYLRDAMTCIASGGTSQIMKIVISGATLK